MKSLLFALTFVLSSTFCFGQLTADTLTVRINFLVEKTINKTIDQAETTELRKYIFKIQNTGFALEEKKQDYSNALIEIDKALAIWTAIGDTLSMANLNKYKGYLFGKIGEFDKGKQEINLAIALYNLKKYDSGVAVSQHDFSLLYESCRNLDSALYFELLSNDYWQKNKDPFRLIVSNNQLINIYVKSNRNNAALEIQKQNQRLAKKKDLHWNPIINFYYISYILFKENNDEKFSSKYKKLYDAKIAELNADGIVAKSIYE